MLPVTPMTSVTTSGTIDRGSKVSETTDPFISTEAPPAYCDWRYLIQCSLQHLDVPPDPPKVFLQIDILHLRSEWNTVDVLCVQDFAVESVGLLVLVPSL